MANRIYYKPHDYRENVLESTRIYVSRRTGARYIIRLDLNNMIYEVKNMNTQIIYRGGDSINNLNVLKRSARARLESLGVVLGTETRNRSFGLCSKGYNQQKHLEENNEDEGSRRTA